MADKTGHLKSLGSETTKYRLDKPDPSLLETFENQYQNRDYNIEFNFPEYTSLCPKTGQPDFATINIEYVADKLCIESKSLKLYLFSYRNHGAFMESIVNKMLNDLVNCCSPRWMFVEGKFNVRGGIYITVEASYHSA